MDAWRGRRLLLAVIYASTLCLWAQADAVAAERASRYDVPEHDPPHCTARFCVHWVESTADAPNLADGDLNGVPDSVERTAHQFEATATRIHAPAPEGLDWRPPKGDGSLGGDTDKTDVYIDGIGGDTLGKAPLDGGSAADGSRSGTGYVVLDRSLTDPGREAWLADVGTHEYTHVVQYGYDAVASNWLLESTAAWMQEAALPDLNLWQRFMPFWVSATRTSLTFEGSRKAYGSAMWSHWLAGRYGPSIIRDTWERSRSEYGLAEESLAAFDAAIAARGRGAGFGSEFTLFAAALPEWQRAGAFPDAAALPDVERSSSAVVDGPAVEVTLPAVSLRLIDIPVRRVGGVRLEAEVPANAPSSIALVGRDRASGAVTTEIATAADGAANVSIAQPGRFDRLTAVVAHPHRGAWNYSARAAVRAVSLPGDPGPAAPADDETGPPAPQDVVTDRSVPRVGLSVRRSVGRRELQRGFVISVRASERGRARVVLLGDRREGPRRSTPTERVRDLLADASFPVGAGSSKRVRVKLGRRARDLVARRRPTRLLLQVAVADPEGNTGRARRTLAVRR